MTITSVEKLRRPARHYLIQFDNGNECSVHEDTMIRFRLLKGADMSQQQYKQMLQYEQTNKAYRAALRYLTRRPRSSGEIRDKLLEQGYESEEVLSVIANLEEQGYIDDRQFARSWAQERIQFGKKGRSLIQFEMRQKGLSAEQIAEAFQHVDDDAELHSAYALLCKKLPNLTGESEERKRKAGHYLLRKGFTHATIRLAFRKWNEEQGVPPL